MQRHAEPRHHFVDNQKRTVLCAEFPHRVDEFLRGRDHIHVARDGFNDYAGNVFAVSLKAVNKRLRVVVFENERVFGKAGGHTGRRGVSEREHARTRFHEQAVGVTVVAPLKLHDLVAARVAARKANRAHAGFGAGTH